jgi:hypothetical protein
MQPFGPWLPDIAAFQSGAATVANNVVPSSRGFKPFNAFVAEASALAARVVGAITCRRQTAPQTFNMSGTATALFKLDSGGMAWTDVTRTVGGAYTTPDDKFWSFAQFGDHIIGTNQADEVQDFDMSVSTDFENLAGSPPQAQFVGVVRDFVVLAAVENAYNRLHWSGINDVTAWTPSATTMSDYQDIAEGGNITGFAGGDVGLVFCEKAIYRMAFEGPPIIFRFDRLSASLGCFASRSVATYDNLTFFLSHDGPYMIRGASELVPIGSEKIDNWLKDNANLDEVSKFTGAIDPVNKLYILGFCSTGNNQPDKMVIYHWPTGEWSSATVDHDMIYAGARQDGLTIDGLTGTIDALPYTFDSFFYSGTSQLRLAGFNASHEQGFFSGAALAAEIETGDVQLTEGRKSLLRGLRPMVHGDFTGPSVAIGYRDKLHDDLTYGLAVTANDNGFCNLRVNARYHRAKVGIPASSVWSHAIGVDDIKFSSMGAR